MILDEGEDQKGKYFKASLIDRYALTLDNYASSDWGNRFYSPEYLEGFCQRRNEIHKEVGKTTGTVFTVSLLLSFFQNVEGNVTIWGISFSIPEIASLALCVFISLGLYVLVHRFIEQLIIDRLLNTLGNRIGAFSFELALLNLTAQNLWTSALTPKFHGLASEPSHERLFWTHNFLIGAVALVIVSFPIALIGYTIQRFLLDQPTFITYALTFASLFFISMAVFTAFVFSLKFKFRPSGFSEPTTPFIPESFLEMGHPVGEEDASLQERQTQSNKDRQA